jgi:hypothetical protein
MSDSNKENLESACRQLLLSFYSSEINTHGRVLIGFGVIMFSILSVRFNLIAPLAIWKLLILYVGIGGVAWALFYLLFRLVGYGILANATIHAPSTTPLKQEMYSAASQLVTDIGNYVKNKDKWILSLFPVEWFVVFGGVRRQRRGFIFTLVLSIVTTGFMYLLIEV